MRKPISVLGASALAAGALLLGACGSSDSPKAAAGPTEVHVTLTDFKVTLDKTSIPAGPVKFIVDNGGAVLHEVVLEPAGVGDAPFEVNGKVSELEDVEPGTKAAAFEWTIDKAGNYQLACHVSKGVDHYEKGMVATFAVV